MSGERLRQSWDDNAGRWTRAVRAGVIASRRLATDAAMVDAILARRPATVLDVGCGEGWLARALFGRGIAVTGMDCSAHLVEEARRAGNGTFLHLDYQGLLDDPSAAAGPFDVAAVNFALLDDRAAPLFHALAGRLAPGGAIILQTLHPIAAGPPYADGWRNEDFTGFGEPGWAPMPWYFRTLGSWLAEISAASLRLDGLVEPRHPETGAPLSLLMIVSAS